MRQIVRRTHAAEQREHGDLHSVSEDGHTAASQDIVHADGAQEGALARHVGTRDDVVVVVADGEAVADSLLAEERMS